MAWQSATTGHNSIASTGKAVASGVLPLDINGDGIKDLVWAASGTWRYMLGGASGFGSVKNTTVAATNPTKAMVLEWNGDGLDDLLIDWSDGKWRVLLGGVNGLGSTIYQAGPGGISSTGASNAWNTDDVNGDGRDDLLLTQLNAPLVIWVRLNGVNGFGSSSEFYSDSSLQTTSKGFIRYTGASSRSKPDFNGDGQTDLLVYGCIWEAEPPAHCVTTNRWWQLIPYGSSFINAGNLPGADYNIDVRFADFNGDGLTDIVYPSTGGTWTIGLGQGSDGFAYVTGPSHAADVTYQTLTGDYDGDGLDDFYVTDISSNNWKVYRSTGTGLAAAALSTTLTGSGLSWMLVDQNGDSLPDLGKYNSSGNLTWRWATHSGVPGELLAGATDGLGNTIGFEYLPMSNPAVYQTVIIPAYPDRVLASSRPLVQQIDFTPAAGAGSAYNITYKYKEARVNAIGRSFLGMGWREFTDNRDNAYFIETYKQAFPVVGAPETSRLFQSPTGAKVFDYSYQYNHHLLDATPGNERYLPFQESSDRLVYEVGGAKNALPISEIVETRDVNTFGNLESQTVTTYDRDTGSGEFGMSYQTQASATYKENVTNWCISAPTSRSETRTLPDLSSKTRSVSWTVSASQCRVTKETIEPGGSSDVSLVTDFGYDTCGNVNSVSSYPAGQSGLARTTEIDFGSRCQRPEIITDPEGDQNPVGHQTRLEYDWRLGLPIAHTDPNEFIDTTNPKKTLFEYDGFGRLTRQVRIDDTATRYAYTACGTSGNWCGTGNTAARLEIARTERKTTDTVLRTDTQILDGLSRVRWTKSDTLESPSIVQTLYDQLDRPVARSAPYFTGTECQGQPCWTVYDYDLLGRITNIDAPIDSANVSGRSTVIKYEGRDLKITDPRGFETTRTRNVLGQLRSLTDPSPGGITTYAYKPFGELAEIDDASGNASTWEYNDRGFLIGTTDADAGPWTYGVNAFGETTNIRDAKTTSPAWTTIFGYDKLSRLTTRFDVPENETTTFTWGVAGDNSDTNKFIGKLKSVSMSSTNYSETYTYDEWARLYKLRTTIDSENFDFDLRYVTSTGLLNTLQYPTSTGSSRFRIQYQYQNNVVDLVKEYQGATLWSAVSTDSWGHYRDEDFGNGVSVFTDFDPATGLMTSRYGGTSGNNRIDAELGWDLNNNLTRRFDRILNPDTEELFQYDALNRLYHSTLNGNPNLDITYNNPVGNIDNKNSLAYNYAQSQSGCSYYAYSQPHAVRKIGTTVYCYDKNGNMVKRGGLTVTYASFNLPTLINASGGSSELFYGASKNRYKQIAIAGGVSETTLYVAGLFERVTPSNGPTEYRHYVPGGKGIAAILTRRSNGTNDTYYVHVDHLGSPEVFTGSAGQQLVRPSFSAYGERRDGSDWSGPTSASDLATIEDITRRGFTGHENLDSVGLIHMNGRVYDPYAGRFLGADPIVHIGNSQSPNSYSYVWNDPLTMIDPSGLDGDVTDNEPQPLPFCSYDDPLVAMNCPYWNGSWGRDRIWLLVHAEENTEGLAQLRSYKAYLDNDRQDRKSVLANYAADFGRGLRDAIPGAYYGGQSEIAFKQGDYLSAGIFAVASLSDAALGVMTLGEGSFISTSLTKGVQSAGGIIRRFEQPAEQIYYRVFSENAAGKWLTAIAPKSAAWAREALSLPPGNAATFIQEVRVPAGTLLERSRALAVPEWGRYRGGAEQFQLLEEIPLSSFGPRVPFP